MSAYSTIYITRSKAKSLLLESIMCSLCDSTLETFMNKLLQDRLYECKIVDDSYDNNEDNLI